MSAFLIGVFGLSSPVFSRDYKQIVIATGSPLELGLIGELAKIYQAETGVVVRSIKTPTGPGLDFGRNGLTHITMGHNREATAKFFDERHALERVDLMHNFTIVVGPPSDPAKVEGLTDLKEVQKRIFESNSPYLSRGDGGGMNIVELKLWKALNLDPNGKSWYVVSSKFMLDSLLDADKNGQYHMLDSSTWTLHKSKVNTLKLLVKGPPNEYEMCLVNPAKHPNLQYNQEAANRFFEFLISDKGQKIIADFGVAKFGEPIYYPTAKKSKE